MCVGGIYRIYDRCLPSCHLLCFAMLQITASPPACAPPPTSGRSSTSVVDIDPKAFARTLNYPSLHLVPTCPNYTCFTIITTLIEDLQWGIKSVSRQKVIQFILAVPGRHQNASSIIGELQEQLVPPRQNAASSSGNAWCKRSGSKTSQNMHLQGGGQNIAKPWLRNWKDVQNHVRNENKNIQNWKQNCKL